MEIPDPRCQEPSSVTLLVRVGMNLSKAWPGTEPQ